jgi:hypothetical protein
MADQLTQAFTDLHMLSEDVPKPRRLPTQEEINGIKRELDTKLHLDLDRYLLEASDVVFGQLEPITIVDPSWHTHLTSVISSASAGRFQIIFLFRKALKLPLRNIIRTAGHY